MALFNRQKKTSAKADKKAGQVSGQAGRRAGALEDILIRPRITEKAVLGTDRGVYVFQVQTEANRTAVAQAIRQIYGVSPRKVNLANVPKKRVRRRGIRGVKGGGRKAYVYLKAGDKIDIM